MHCICIVCATDTNSLCQICYVSHPAEVKQELSITQEQIDSKLKERRDLAKEIQTMPFKEKTQQIKKDESFTVNIEETNIEVNKKKLKTENIESDEKKKAKTKNENIEEIEDRQEDDKKEKLNEKKKYALGRRSINNEANFNQEDDFKKVEEKEKSNKEDKREKEVSAKIEENKDEASIRIDHVDLKEDEFSKKAKLKRLTTDFSKNCCVCMSNPDNLEKLEKTVDILDSIGHHLICRSCKKQMIASGDKFNCKECKKDHKFEKKAGGCCSLF